MGVGIGRWYACDGADGKALRTFTIITTEPNRLVRPIHDRMPVILEEHTEQPWLDPTLTDPQFLTSLLMPYRAEQLEMQAVTGRL